jgi:hypothetical protein
MKVHCRWHFRIEGIAVRLPAGFANHGRQMICGEGFESPDRNTAESQKLVSGAKNRVGRAIQIDIGLHSKTRILHVP